MNLYDIAEFCWYTMLLVVLISGMINYWNFLCFASNLITLPSLLSIMEHRRDYSVENNQLAVRMLVVLGIGLGVIIFRFIIFTVKTLLLMKCVSYEERKEEYKAIIGCYTPIFESILGIGGAAVIFCGMLYFSSFILHG